MLRSMASPLEAAVHYLNLYEPQTKEDALMAGIGWAILATVDHDRTVAAEAVAKSVLDFFASPSANGMDEMKETMLAWAKIVGLLEPTNQQEKKEAAIARSEDPSTAANLGRD